MKLNMIDDGSLYVIHESFIHPSDKWIVCSQNHVHIFIIFIYKFPHKFTNNFKALEVRKYHRNLELIELFPSAQSPCRNKNFVSTSQNLLKNGISTFPIVLFHMKTFVSKQFFTPNLPPDPFKFEIFDNCHKSKTFYWISNYFSNLFTEVQIWLGHFFRKIK